MMQKKIYKRNKTNKGAKGGKGKPPGLKEEKNQLPPSELWTSKKCCIQLVDYMVKKGRFNSLHQTRKKNKQNEQDNNELAYQEEIRIVDDDFQDREQRKAKIYNIISQRRNQQNAKIKGVIVFFFESKTKPIEIQNGELVFPNNNDIMIQKLDPKYRDVLMLLKNMIKVSFQQELYSLITNSQNSDRIYDMIADQIKNENLDRNIGNCDEIMAALFLGWYEKQDDVYKLTDNQIRQNIDEQWAIYVESEECIQDLQEFISEILASFESEDS